MTDNPSLYASGDRRISRRGILHIAFFIQAASFIGLAVGQEAPCVACLTFTLTADQGARLAAEAGRFDALEVLLRVAPGDAEPRLEETLRTLAATGVRVGLELSGEAPSWDAWGSVLRLADAVLLRDTGTPSSDLATTVYRLKTRATLLRASHPTLRIGVEADALPNEIAAELAGHVDFIVTAVGGSKDLPSRSKQDTKDPHSGSGRAGLQTRLGVARWIRRPWPPTVGDAAMRDLARVPPGADRVLIDLTSARVPDDLTRLLGRLQSEFAFETEVVGRRTLSVQEIIARHQAQAARQARLMKTLISTGSFVVAFDVPGFTGPVTITSDAVVYTAAGQTDVEHRSIRVNGLAAVAVDSNGVPRLPLIDAEQVSAPPLTIMLTERYAYRLDGQERVGEAECYVVRFEPRSNLRHAGDRPESLFRGRAWIRVDTFALMRLTATQTGLRGPVTASEQTDTFVPVRITSGSAQNEAALWLLGRSEVNQTYEGAGHRAAIQRVLAVTEHEVNTPSFIERRAAAYASRAVMVRQTQDGLKYLRRTGDGSANATARRVADRAQRVRALAFGVIVDPNITDPLPFAGLNYADFDAFGTGGQLNAFFGGMFGQVAATWPSAGGTRWQLSGGASATLARYNDRAFRGGIERYAENVRQRPANVRVALSRPISARTRLRTEYRLEVTTFDRAETTAENFAVPADAVVHGARVAMEARRGAWDGVIWWHPARRQRWQAWGRPDSDEYRPEHRDFQRFGASAGRPVVLSPRFVGRLELEGHAGRDLDRFSRYSFGTFEHRMRGYPSASIRYDRGGAAHLAMTWTAGPRLRLDGFLDVALVRDPGLSRRPKGHTGLGAALEAPLPLGVLLTVEWGYGFQARDTNGERGTHVVRVTGYRVF